MILSKIPTATSIIEEYEMFIKDSTFACIAAKAAIKKRQVKSLVASHMACPSHDVAILQFLYAFVDEYRVSGGLYHSAVIIFTAPICQDEHHFDHLMWTRLQALSDMDAAKYQYDKRVGAEPSSASFSYSLKQEAFFVIGLHPQSSRPSRRFRYPAIVFNPHQQFEQLRQSGKYEIIKSSVRKREMAVSGSINPMLHDFGHASEVYQYSGVKYDSRWHCPLKINHAK